MILNGVAKEKLVTVTTKFKESRVLSDIEIDKIKDWEIQRPDKTFLENWINMLEKFNIFFSAPLDIDFLMLQYYKDDYLRTLSASEGPVVSYIDGNGDNRKIKITKMDRENVFFKKHIEEAVQATLKGKSGPGDSFTGEEKELMIWYQYFFLGRGKPTTHMQFLSSISDDKLKRTLPPVFEKMVKRVEELLGDIEHGEE